MFRRWTTSPSGLRLPPLLAEARQEQERVYRVLLPSAIQSSGFSIEIAEDNRRRTFERGYRERAGRPLRQRSAPPPLLAEARQGNRYALIKVFLKLNALFLPFAIEAPILSSVLVPPFLALLC